VNQGKCNKENRILDLDSEKNVVLIVCRKIDKNRETYIRVLLRS